ncbi:MAG: hypothetical protein ACHP8B_10885 [Terriglobales bacterium]
MGITVANQAVVAIVQKAADWAVILVAERKRNGMRVLTPWIVASEQADTFATCPALDAYDRAGQVKVLRTRQLEPHQRKTLLDNSVADLIKFVAQCADILEIADSEGRRWPAKKCAKLGLLRRVSESDARATSLANFHFADGCDAFQWLLGQGNDAWTAVCAIRVMAVKHKLDTLTHAERESKWWDTFWKNYGPRGGRRNVRQD